MLILEFSVNEGYDQLKTAREDPHCFLTDDIFYFKIYNEEDTLENRLIFSLKYGPKKIHDFYSFKEIMIEMYGGPYSLLDSCQDLLHIGMDRVGISRSELPSQLTD